MSADLNTPRRPNRNYRIVFQHGIGAPDDELAHEMIEHVIRGYLGGNTKFADKAWDRLRCGFEVEEVERGTQRRVQ